jgi:hypothetical protein
MTKQVQKGGDHSTNIQAKQVCITHGISYEEAHQIAIDVFNANFLKLSEEALEKVNIRAEEITEQFLRKLKEQNEEGIARARDPDFQHALFTVQKEYARIGDKELGDLLVDLLVDRTKYKNRSILEIVLNESLSVAPKLTNDQIAALSVIFILGRTKYQPMNNIAALAIYLDNFILPFVELISKRESCYRHLEYAGCGSISLGSTKLDKIFLKHYSGLFSRGFILEEVLNNKKIDVPIDSPIFIKCLHNEERFQLNALNEDVLREKATKLNIDEDNIKKLIDLNNTFVIKGNELKKYLMELRPYMNTIFEVWENSLMKRFDLTSVGIAIAHANIKRIYGEFADLSIWIN